MIKSVRQCRRWCGEVVEKGLDVEIAVKQSDFEKYKNSDERDVEWQALGAQFSIGFVVVHFICCRSDY